MANGEFLRKEKGYSESGTFEKNRLPIVPYHYESAFLSLLKLLLGKKMSSDIFARTLWSEGSG